MKTSYLCSRLSLMAAPITLLALSLTGVAQTVQGFSSSTGDSANSYLVAGDAPDGAAGTGSGGSIRGYTMPHATSGDMRPLSRVALGVSISPLGIGLQTTTNLTGHVNLRGSGSFFEYNANNFSAQGFNVNADIHMASAGMSADYYPFHDGFRISPGVLFYNQNRANATFLAEAGTSFTLNDHTYYSAKGANAVQGTGLLGLGNGSPAFTMTTGWGNSIPRSGKHLSFPFEIGVAFTKTPSFSLGLTGYVCDRQGQNCVDVATDPTAQADLAVQVKKYQNDADLLRFYPIVSFGVAYSFGTRPGGWGK